MDRHRSQTDDYKLQIQRWKEDGKFIRLLSGNLHTSCLTIDKFLRWTAFISIIVNLAHNKFCPDVVSLTSLSITFFLVAIGVSFMSFIVQFKTIDASCESLLKKEENKAELTNSFFYFSYILGSICYLIGLCLLIHSFLGYS